MRRSQRYAFTLIFLISSMVFLSGGLCAQSYVFGRAGYATGNYPSAVAAADFNGDGRLDVAVVNTLDKTVSIQLGNADSTLQPQSILATGTTPVALLIADFNGDGKFDLAVSNLDDNTVSIFLGNGDGTFGGRADYPTDIGPRTIAFVDLDSDHRGDLLVATESGTVSVLLGNGDGTFQGHVDFPAAPGAGLGQAGVLVVGDLNGDGKMDVAYPDVDNDTVAVLLGNGDGTFQPFVQYPTARGPDGVAVADFNGDGHLDLAVTSSFQNSVSLLSGNGDGTFQTHQEFAVGPTPGEVVAVDLNGDGKFDLVTANQSCENCAGSLSVLLGNGDGTFNTDIDYSTGLNPAFAVSDFNGDGHPDFAIVHGLDNSLQVLIGYGDGTFPEWKDISSGLDSDSIVVADFNGDSYPDLAVDNDTLSTVTVLLGDGKGGFPSTLDSPSGGNLVTITAGDFNHDGKVDIAGTHSNDSSVAVMLANGDGTFGSPVNFPTGTMPGMILNADLNNDGHLDVVLLDQIVIAGQPSGAISILLGNGDGTFKAHVDYPPGGNFVTVADLNGDGKLDLVTTNGSTQGAISILLGNGDGTFQNAVSYPTNPSPGSVAAADFNGDGKIDLAVTSFAATSLLAIYLGNGDGTFGQPQQFDAGSFAGSAVAGDFNGDGKMDVAITAYTGVSVLLGNGDGTFRGRRYYPLVQPPTALVAGDFDGDGGLDLAASRLSGGSALSVFLNRPVAALSPTQVDFGTQTIAGITAAQTLLVSNPGAARLNFDEAALAGADSGDFLLTIPCAAQIPVGGNCAISAAFRPTAAGQRTAQVSVMENAPGRPLVASLTGKGTGPGVIFSTTTVSFPLQAIGVTSSAMQVTLTNSGDQLLNITAIAIAGSNSGDFTQTNTCGTLPVAISPGSTCTFNVSFTSSPSGGIVRTANLSVTDNALDSAQSVLLIGNVTTPEASFSSASLTFGQQIVGTTSTGQATTLSNVGNAPLSIQSVRVTGPDSSDFSQVTNCPISPATLAAGASCTATANFKPSDVGDKTATITFAHNAGCCGQDILLSGSGSDFSMAATPASSVVAAGQSATYTLSVNPTGGFNQTVQLTCAGAPQAASCTISPNSVTPDGTHSSAATLTITTGGSAEFSAIVRSLGALATAVGFAGLILLPRLPISRNRQRAIQSMACLGLLVFSGCGQRSTSPKTAPGDYTLTVSGSSGGVTRTTTVMLTVR